MVIAFTGHRPKTLFPEAPNVSQSYAPLYKALIQRLILEDKQNGGITVATGGAQGADQIAFFSADTAKQYVGGITNILYIPMEGQEKRWSDSGAFNRNTYQKMRGKADKVIVCRKAADGYEEAKKAMLVRDQMLVDAADFLYVIAKDVQDARDMFDGTAKGGTAHTVSLALSAHKWISFFDRYGNDITAQFTPWKDQ